MKIRDLFSLYESKITDEINSNEVFSQAGMTNVYARLDYGFFPLGSGVLDLEKSRIENAELENCKIMVLGNDFGTEFYLENNCPNNKEKTSNPTIRNLIGKNGLDLNLKTTFFTNLYLGLRDDKRHPGTTMIKSIIKKAPVYKKLCFDFLKIQLDFINPEIVLCLGNEVCHSLSKNKEFAGFSSANNVINTNDIFFGSRKFILIPHPSFAHINWAKDNMKEKIKDLILK